MTITAITGDIGSGKSFYQLAYGLWDCNRKRKRLVTNFALNIPELKKYAALKKFGWLGHILDTGQYAVVDCNDMQDILKLLNKPRSIVLLDEAGIFLNARGYQQTPKSLLRDLFQSRKDAVDLYYCAQFDGQVDLQFRKLTQYFIHADGLSRYCPILGKPRLHWKTYYHFKAADYWDWAENTKARRNGLLTFLMYAFDTEYGPLNDADRQLFKCFDSFARLEKQGESARDIELSPLDLSPSKFRLDSLRVAYKLEYKRCSRFFGAVRWRSPLLRRLENSIKAIEQSRRTPLETS